MNMVFFPSTLLFARLFAQVSNRNWEACEPRLSKHGTDATDIAATILYTARSKVCVFITSLSTLLRSSVIYGRLCMYACSLDGFALADCVSGYNYVIDKNAHHKPKGDSHTAVKSCPRHNVVHESGVDCVVVAVGVWHEWR